jgi:hypothetical protein
LGLQPTPQLPPTPATAAEITALRRRRSSSRSKHAFEHDTGTRSASNSGSVVGATQNKFEAGAKNDLAILSTAAVAAAEKVGAGLAGKFAVAGRAEIGVAVRDGTPAPDISLIRPAAGRRRSSWHAGAGAQRVSLRLNKLTFTPLRPR